MNPAPKIQGAPPLEPPLPATIDEAVAYLESKFTVARDGFPSAYDETDGIRSVYVTLACITPASEPMARERLIAGWIITALNEALNSKRELLLWRMRPKIEEQPLEGTMSIVSRLAMR